MIKLYGPYFRKDGRKHIIKHNTETKRRTTVSYPKHLMEEHLGRDLLPNETVNHINRNFTDNRLCNLEILDRSEHAKLDAKRVKRFIFTCEWCGEIGSQQGHNLDGNEKQGKAGPFCSRSCAGSYGAYVQNGGEKRGRTTFKNKREYYYNT